MKYGKEYFDFCKHHNQFNMNDLGEWQEEYLEFLKNVFHEHILPNNIYLDVGCATGNYLELFRKHDLLMYGCDVDQWYIDSSPFALIKERLRLIVDNKIPFEDDQFDFIHMCQVIEHIPESCMIEELMEIKRTLKKGGILYISTIGEGPAIPPPGEDPTHISCFSREKWERIFKECGFWNRSKSYLKRISEDKFAKNYDWVNFVLSK